MKLLRRSSLWGTVGIIAILVISCIHLHARNEHMKLKEYNKVLCTTINNQTNLINDLKEENSNLNIHISQLEKENLQLQQEKSSTQCETESKTESQITTPTNHNDFKSYMPYTTITNEASKQLELQQQAYTDSNGLRCIDNRPMIAVGTGWGVSVGDIVLVTCENNNSFEAIIGDIKDNVDTNADNKTTSDNNCRCEFIVDMDKLNSHIKISGNVAVLKQYSGYVIDIQKID